MSAAPEKKTIDDLLRLGEEARAELIHGDIHDKPEASGEHGIPQARIAEWTGRRFGRKPGGKWPGGWWIGSEIVVVYARDEVYRHDLAGYRRERAPELPRQRTWMTLRPDWVCEILSPGHEKRDLVNKLVTLHRIEVPHYWVVDRVERILHAYRYTPGGYQLACTAGPDATVRAEPFDAVELRTNVLFGDEDDEE